MRKCELFDFGTLIQLPVRAQNAYAAYRISCFVLKQLPMAKTCMTLSMLSNRGVVAKMNIKYGDVYKYGLGYVSFIDQKTYESKRKTSIRAHIVLLPRFSAHVGNFL